MSASSRRHRVDKKESSKAFNRAAGRTKAPNVAAAPMRGGWRL